MIGIYFPYKMILELKTSCKSTSAPSDNRIFQFPIVEPQSSSTNYVNIGHEIKESPNLKTFFKKRKCQERRIFFISPTNS